jgi:hypothetical protein
MLGPYPVGDQMLWKPADVCISSQLNSPANKGVMNQLEESPHSFIVKIRPEGTDEAGRATWHGYITHVPSGERRYLRDPGEVIAFMRPYLEEMGVKFTMRWWLRSCLNQMFECLRGVLGFRRVKKANQGSRR